MKLIALSGGVDSMVLAHLYKDEDIVLAFVNYNIRHDVKVDQFIVQEFAKKNNLKLEIKIIEDEPIKNFQNWARVQRYDFFLDIYKKYNCDELLIAHHKDDFLETCLMQKQKNSNKIFYGIKEKINFKGMNIFRPLLFKYWKSEIYEFAKKNNISYNDDYTNFEDKYVRNKIRKQLINFTNQQKQDLLNDFLKINEKNKTKESKIQEEYQDWLESKFNVKLFKTFVFQNELIVLFINNNYEGTKLNNNIIENIKLFIKSQNGNKKFVLTNNKFIHKINNQLKLK